MQTRRTKGKRKKTMRGGVSALTLVIGATLAVVGGMMLMGSGSSSGMNILSGSPSSGSSLNINGESLNLLGPSSSSSSLNSLNILGPSS